MPTMRRNPAGGVIDTTGMGRGAGVVRSPMAMQAFRRGGRVRGYQEGGEVDDDDQQPYQVAQATPDTMRGGGNTDVIQDAVTRTLNPPVQEMYERLNPPKGSGSAYRDILDYQAARNPRVRAAMNEGSQMPEDPGIRARRPPPQPQQTVQTGRAEVRSTPAWSGWLSDKLHGAVSPGLNTRAGSRRPVIEPEYAGGGYVDDEGLENQGADDAMIDPMAMVSSAMNYGKKKYGLPVDDQEIGFDDGGVVPTEGDQAQGNPNAIDPRQAMAYLAGDGAVSPEIAQALEQRVDPQGQLNPTQRAVAAIGVAPNDEAKFGLIQHYRTKYNGFAAAAKAAMAQGDMGEAAHQASLAMDSVPNGQRTQFAPAQGGLAMISRPAFRQGGGKPAAPQQQAFDDGGVVEDDDEVLSRLQPQPQADPPDAIADAPTEDVPVQEPLVGSQPEVMPVQSVAQLLDKGFDEHLKAVQAQAARLPGARPYNPYENVVSAGDLDAAAAQQGAQLQGWESAEEKAGQPQSSTFLPASWLHNQIKGSLLPSTYAAQPGTPAPTTGSEASVRDTEGPPVPIARGSEQRFPPTGAPVTAPVTQQGVIPEGAVVDEDRVNPFTGQVRAAVPGTFGSREAARRAGTTVPMNEAAARGGGTEGVVPTAAAAPERAMPRGNFGDSTGTLNLPAKEAPLTGKWAHRGGRPANEEEQETERVQRRAAAAYPWVGADAGKRDAEIAAGLKRDDEYRKEMGKQKFIEQRSAARDIANLEKTDVLERGRTDRANQLAQDNLTRDRQRQASQERMNIVRSKLNAASNAERSQLQYLARMIQADPGLAHDTGRLKNLAAPVISALKLRPDELVHAAEIASTYDPTSGTYDPKYGTGYGGPGGVIPAGGGGAPEGAYPEGIEVGTSVPKNTRGGPKNYILGPDGKTMWREDVYKKRFGG